MKSKLLTLVLAGLVAAGANAQNPGEGSPTGQEMPGGNGHSRGQMGPRDGGRGHQQRDWFKGVDTNNDGRIDGEELQGAGDRTFSALDKNGNGTIEQDEFHVGPPRPPRDGGQQRMQGQEGGGERAQNRPDGEMLPRGGDGQIGPGEDRHLLPPFFFDRQLRDGALSKADFNIAAQAAFKQLDKNEDGVLTPDEARPPRHEGGNDGGEQGGPPPPPNAEFVGAELRFGDRLIQGHPFSADIVFEDTRRLFDGTTATKKMTGAIYRDSAGRTRREQPLEMIGGVQIAATDGKPQMLVFINDFGTRTQTFLDANNKIARTNPIGDGPRPDGHSGPVARNGGQSESLGSKTIDGVKVDGTRDTFQVPAGHLGNDKPIDVVTENWFSSELGVIVMSRHLDPIAGEHTFRLTNIRLGEPSAELFSVPGGYKLENRVLHDATTKSRPEYKLSRSAHSTTMLDEVITTRLQSEAQFPAASIPESDPISDDAMVELVLSGDETAFAEIFERYKRHVTRTVGRFFKERTEVEEHVQQSFVKAYTSLSRYHGGVENSFAAWLTRITINICYDEFRRRQRRGQSLFSEMTDEEVDYVETIADGRERSPEQRLSAAELANRVLRSLDPMDRVAMTLVYTEERSLDEVSRSLGISLSNLKSRLFRCRNHIKKRYSHLF